MSLYCSEVKGFVEPCRECLTFNIDFCFLIDLTLQGMLCEIYVMFRVIFFFWFSCCSFFVLDIHNMSCRGVPSSSFSVTSSLLSSSVSFPRALCWASSPLTSRQRPLTVTAGSCIRQELGLHLSESDVLTSWSLQFRETTPSTSLRRSLKRLGLIFTVTAGHSTRRRRNLGNRCDSWSQLLWGFGARQSPHHQVLDGVKVPWRFSSFQCCQQQNFLPSIFLDVLHGNLFWSTEIGVAKCKSLLCCPLLPECPHQSKCL